MVQSKSGLGESVNPVTTNAAQSLGDVKDTNTVYRLWKDGTGGNEYFLVENRQKKNYDSQLPGAGLLIWHIDDSIASNSNENHPKVAVVQAAQEHLHRSAAKAKRHFDTGPAR